MARNALTPVSRFLHISLAPNRVKLGDFGDAAIGHLSSWAIAGCVARSTVILRFRTKIAFSTSGGRKHANNNSCPRFFDRESKKERRKEWGRKGEDFLAMTDGVSKKGRRGNLLHLRTYARPFPYPSLRESRAGFATFFVNGF